MRTTLLLLLTLGCSETSLRSTKDVDTAAPASTSPSVPSTTSSGGTTPGGTPAGTTPTGTTSTPGPTGDTGTPDLPPRVTEVRVVPEEAYEDSVLTCQAAAEDPEGDPIEWSWAWTVDGSPVGDDSPSLDGAWFDKHQSVTCTATPVGGVGVESAEVVIRNTPPVQPTPVIRPDPAVVGDVLACEADRPTDLDPADAGLLEWRFAWYADGLPVGASDRLDTSPLAVGAAVTCEVTPTDPDEAGLPATSDPVVLGDGCSPGERDCPGLDCADLLALGVDMDGWYWIDPPCSDVREVWCDQTTDGGGWTRVRGDDYAVDACPAPWVPHPDYPFCTRDGAGGFAQSVFTETWCIDYAEVRGNLVGYQYSSMDGFGDDVPVDLEAIYGDGLSLTLGGVGARLHLHTWAVGFGSDSPDDSNCPDGPGGDPSPAFVGPDFACESGNPGPGGPSGWYPDTPLYDDHWFQVGAPGVGDLESRLMASHGTDNEDLGVGEHVLYVR